MAGPKKFYDIFVVGILLSYSKTIAIQAEDIRAIVTDVIRSELAALNSPTGCAPNNLALKLQEITTSLEEIKETLMQNSVRSGDSIRDTLSAVSSDIAVIKTKLTNSRDAFSGTTATPTTHRRMVTTGRPATARNVPLTDFDDLVRRKLTPRTGSTFNGSTVNDIMSSVSRAGDGGRGVVVVFINHLDRTINNFKMYDPKNTSLHPAPSSIEPHTKEVFTFAETSCCLVTTAFSYNIPGSSAGIATFMNMFGVNSFGVAFVPPSASMEQYFKNRTGIPGSSQNDNIRLMTRQLIVEYKNLYSKIKVSSTGTRKATVVIEIVENMDGAISEITPLISTSEQNLASEISKTERFFDTEPYNSTTNTRDAANVQTLRYFDELVRRKPTPETGKTLNGSTTTEIKSKVSSVGDGGNGIVVLFVNHLGRTINNFQIYNPSSTALHQAPSSIAPHTKEVFTFAEPKCCYVQAAFSYEIPSSTVRIASFIDFTGFETFGLAFVATSESMVNYFGARTGLPGSFVKDTIQTTSTLVIGYQNLYAKISLHEVENRKATVVIEIVEE